ncbi:MAG: helix-turn-helix domain-containing protein [Candidatus Polarisedimenticolia bacterium]
MRRPSEVVVRVEPCALRLPEAAEFLGLRPAFVRALTARGHLRAVHVGRAVVYRTADLRAFVDRLAAEQAAGAGEAE